MKPLNNPYINRKQMPLFIQLGIATLYSFIGNTVALIFIILLFIFGKFSFPSLHDILYGFCIELLLIIFVNLPINIINLLILHYTHILQYVIYSSFACIIESASYFFIQFIISDFMNFDFKMSLLISVIILLLINLFFRLVFPSLFRKYQMRNQFSYEETWMDNRTDKIVTMVLCSILLTIWLIFLIVSF